MSFLLAASKLPDFMLNHWSMLTGFMINSLLPGLATSSRAFAAVGSWFSSSTGSLGSSISATTTTRESQVTEEAVQAFEERRCYEAFGISPAVKAELDKLVMRYAFAEECSGGNDEARLCLKSLSSISWGALESYPSYITALKEVWEKRVREGGAKLTVRVLLAEEDAMIGEKGEKYLQDCWTKSNVGEGVDVEVITLDATDHDSVLDPMKGAIAEYYKAVKEGRTAFVQEGQAVSDKSKVTQDAIGNE